MIYYDFYKSVKNPLKQERFIEKLMDIYAKPGDFYSNLVYTNTDNKVLKKYFIAVRDDLEAEVFNIWKEGLLKAASTSDRKAIKDLAKYVSQFNPQTEKEVKDIIRSINRSPLSIVFDAYDYNHYNYESGWIYKYSNAIQTDDSYKQKIEHRLYINCDSLATEVIAKKIIDKCRERDLGYCFKYDLYADRSDTLVLYCDSKHLPIYANMLREIRKEIEVEYAEYKGCANFFHKPALLAGKIDGWIGYGSEPSKSDNLASKDRSYNMKRAIHIKKCINEELSEWLRKNKYLKVNYNDYNMNYANFFANVLAKAYQKKTIKSWSKYISDEERGYSKRDAASLDYEWAVTKAIMKNYDQIVDYLAGKKKDIRIEIPFKNGTIYIPKSAIDSLIREHSKIIVRNFPTIKESILKRIKETSKEWNITSNYAFDRHALDSLKREEKDFANSQRTIKVSKNTQKTREQLIDELIEEIANTDDSDLVNQKVKE